MRTAPASSHRRRQRVTRYDTVQPSLFTGAPRALVRESATDFLAVDLYAGSGGTSTGIIQAAQAAGRNLKLCAINHWPVAVESHTINHPGVLHQCVRVEGIRPQDLVPDGRLDLLTASPPCQAHSKAAAGTVRSDQLRAEAWNVVSWVSELRPRTVVMENVEEVRLWGEDGNGVFFRHFLDTLRVHGYHVEWRILNCADFGDPTTRRRLFILASLDSVGPVQWAEPTHGPDAAAPHRTFRECVDRDVLGERVGEKRRAGRVTSAMTFAAIEAGLDLYGGEPFLLRRPQHDNTAESNAKTIDAPIFTITGNATDIALVVPGRGRAARDMDAATHRATTVRELARGHSFPDRYRFVGTRKEAVLQIGNGVPVRTARALVAAHAFRA